MSGEYLTQVSTPRSDHEAIVGVLDRRPSPPVGVGERGTVGDKARLLLRRLAKNKHGHRLQLY